VPSGVNKPLVTVSAFVFCTTATALERCVDGRTVTFGVSGYLYSRWDRIGARSLGSDREPTPRR
jgi:hypothetical protein